MAQFVECVPNFSEGRDPQKVEAIARAIAGVAGVYLLDREMDADHHRSVITFVAGPEAVAEAAFRGVAKAVELIDLTRHQGAHPRLGAADVVPFVPLEGITLEDCVAIARRVGQRIAGELHVPVYLYEAAATRPDRRNLENIRRGQFEGLREEIGSHPERRPDFGEPRVHPTAGATVVGARKFLIAYNINLNTPDVSIAKKIARGIRASSGGLPAVKAMGVELKGRGLAQVSMNLTDFETTSLLTVFEAVKKEAGELGATIAGSEIVGLVPRRALEDAAASCLNIENFSPQMIIENRVAAAVGPALPPAGTAADPAISASLDDFIRSVAAATPAPGGGSVAAAAGALAAALGHKVVAITRQKKKAQREHDSQLAAALDHLETQAAEFQAAVRRDAESYNAVVAAYRLPRDSAERDEAIQKALEHATEVPLEVAERAARLGRLLEALEPIISPALDSDLSVGRLLAEAAFDGALANVEINLGSVKDDKFVAAVRKRLEKLEKDSGMA